MESLNISPYLFGTSAKRSNGSSAPSAYARSNGTSGTTGTSGTNGWLPRSVLPAMNGWAPSGMNTGNWGDSIKRIGAYLLAIAVVVLILLLFIHFFVRPVFRWRPGAPGWIPVPGWDDGTLFWANGGAGLLPNKDLPIHNQYFDYTLQVDLFLENPLQFATHPRLLFTRGGVLQSRPSGDTLRGVLQQYNLTVALKPDTNDMIVSVLNMNDQMETAVLPNVPVQEPFRLTVVVMERAMEVYINGQLLRTTTYQAPPRDVKGDITPALGVEANIVRYRNMKIWPRVLTTPEIRSATPALSTALEMGAGPIPTSSSNACPSPDTSLSSLTTSFSTSLSDSLSSSISSLSSVPSSLSSSFSSLSSTFSPSSPVKSGG